MVKAKLVQVFLAHDGDVDDVGNGIVNGGVDGNVDEVGEGQPREGVPLHGNCLQRILVPPS